MKCFMTNQDCIFEKDIQDHLEVANPQSLLFVVSPFGYPYDDLYNKTISPIANAANIVIQRADKAFQLGFVMCQKICRLIQKASYILADVTEDNPNVYYELGLAWGFGKKILLLRDVDQPASTGFSEVFGESNIEVLTYDELLEFARLSAAGRTDKFKDFLETRSIDVEGHFSVEKMRKQASYISSKDICFCCRKDLSDAKFYMSQINDAVNNLKVALPWNIATRLSPPWFTNNSFIDYLVSSKVLIVDVTHYNRKPDSSIYFVLGLSHSLGRETIPITNKARCGDISPFDVRGLWQIYFDNLEVLKTELSGILTVIDKKYENERSEYPLRFIWDEVLRRPARLSVFTCARGAPAHKHRLGGRTNVDKWDYISVAELAFFLAQKYKQVELSIEPPEEKEMKSLDDVEVKNKLKNNIQKKLANTRNSVIIIGSPDVSDYAETLLADMYEVSPYEAQACEQEIQDKKRKCWECELDTNCVAKCGYLFYKNTESTLKPKETSAFFRKPPDNVKDCIVWYGTRYECEHSQRGKDAHGVTYGILTMLKGRSDKWIILLLGFTGIATYGLAELLTSLHVKTKEGQSLQEKLTNENIDLENRGVQVLISVEYFSANNAQHYDSRERIATKILDVKALRAQTRRGK